ncbi:hypothetical protein [Candidatus Thiosymbion oneisti]|uniref:hypothetical protein n=1 Tax=Candidatus Thiosymbion oneisti TaxID=589554 RepID=UPI00106230E2|nr:hypothetical protein [Candidatus Thiosymbion oneisti]
MKILFISDLLGKDCIGRVPLGVLYLSAALKHSGHTVDLVDTKHFSGITRKIDDFCSVVKKINTLTIKKYIYFMERIRLDQQDRSGKTEIRTVVSRHL